MYPFACCSFTKSSNACCLSCVSWYIFLGIVDGVFDFNSIVWSQIHDSGKCCAASSLKTWECHWYLAGISPLPFYDPACFANLDARVCFFDILDPSLDIWHGGPLGHSCLLILLPFIFIFPTLWLESSSPPPLYFTSPLIHSSPIL